MNKFGYSNLEEFMNKGIDPISSERFENITELKKLFLRLFKYFTVQQSTFLLAKYQKFNAILWVQNETIGSKKMEFLEIKKAIEEMMQKDYKTFVTALISIEKDIDNQEALDMMYEKYMDTDEMHLLNDEFEEMIEVVSV